MAIYNNGTNSFVWNGTRYGLSTLVKFHDEFVKKFTWMGEKICDKGIFYGIYISNGKKMFQFRKYCPDEFLSKHTYPGCFSFTELELLEAIELILRPVPIEEVTACKPPFADKQLQSNYKGKRNFFETDNKYYGQGSKIYIKDEFIQKYKNETECDMTKKVAFLYSETINGEIKYYVASCNDMKTPNMNNYCLTYTLTEDDFFEAIEFITDCYTIKYKDTDEPTIFIFWLIYILIIILSFIVFVKPSAPLVAATLVFFIFRNRLLRQ